MAEVNEKDYYVVLNPRTGELAKPKKKKPGRYGYRMGQYVTVGQLDAEALADLNLTAMEWRTFWLIVAKCEVHGWTPFVATKLAERLGTTQPYMSRVLKRLVDVGLLLRAEYGDGHSHRYRLNPAHVFKGDTQQHQDALRETDARPVSAPRPAAPPA